MSRFWRDGRIAAALRKSFSKASLRRGVVWGQNNVPPGARSLVGVTLIFGGMLGFLPILGFWMIPLGGTFVALDIPPLRRRLLAWLEGEDDRPDKK